MNPYLSKVWCEYQQGDSFLPEARKRISKYKHTINLIQADLTCYKWQQYPVKILLVDAMKNWQLAKSIAIEFYPSLTLGSILIHQDFKHYYTPWIHILQYRLKDYFHFKWDVFDGCTVAFETICKIPYNVVDIATNFDSISDIEVAAAIEYSMNCCKLLKDKNSIAAAHIMYFIHKQDTLKARAVLNLYSNTIISPSQDFSIVKEMVERIENQ
jgi:hypothetical protein